jgi:chemotaxis protein methyltransferase CheR
MSVDSALERAVDSVAELLRARVGLRPEPTVRARLRRCVRDEANALGSGLDAFAYEARSNPEVYQSLLNRVTVQETSFFRHPEQFALLADAILPALQQPVTIWSAGCANGQEAFSLAMVLEEAGIDGRVIATDVSTSALARTAAGRYTEREVAGLSEQRVARHLRPTGTGWQINDSIQRRVTVLRHNLIDPLPAQVRSAQVVFCRNVLIYFSPDHARVFLTNLVDQLPEAALFLGSAESIWTLSDRFDAIHAGGAFLHRRRAETSPNPRPTETRSQPAPVQRWRRTRSAGPKQAAMPAHDEAAALARTGQHALAGGDCLAAIVDFRKRAFLAPDDPFAHLHLALALEAAGDERAAQRAYAAARRALLASDPTQVEYATEGYAGAELIRLLDSKQEVNR